MRRPGIEAAGKTRRLPLSAAAVQTLRRPGVGAAGETGRLPLPAAAVQAQSVSKNFVLDSATYRAAPATTPKAPWMQFIGTPPTAAAP